MAADIIMAANATTVATTPPIIVVLDGHTMNPGDLSWDALRALGPSTIYKRTPPSEVIERAQNATAILTNKTVLDRPVIERLPRLEYIGVTATGYNVVDVVVARDRGIPVTNVPGYSTASVAQLVFALILELTHQVGHHSQTVRAGRWAAGPDFCYWDHPLIELAGLTLGLVGYGQIGQAVARIGRAFGMKVIVHTRTPRTDDPAIRFVDLDTLFSQADVVSLHCPLAPATHGLVNAQRLAQMKPSAFLINTGRGPLVVEADLAAALNANRIAGAGLDVLALEPPAPDNPLLKARNCVITPHFGWGTLAARQRLMTAAVGNLHAFLAGTPQNVVNP